MSTEKLKLLFKDKIKNDKINPNSIRSVLLKNEWIYNEFYQSFEINKNLYKTFSKYLLSLIFDIKLKHCKACNKLLTYDQTVGNALYCSNKCKLSLMENPFSRNDVKEKLKKYFIEKYGVDNPAKADIIKNKAKETCIKRYGVDNYSKTIECKKLIINNQIEKYGKLYSQTDEFRERTLKTNLEKYGVKHKNILNAWNKINKLDKAIPLFTLNEFENSNHKKDFMKFKCKFCGNEFLSRYDNGSLTSKCKCQFIKSSIHGSLYEDELFQFLESLNFNVEKHIKLDNHQEIDLFIKDKKLAIEFNGVYWHSVNNNHGNGYHLNKVLKCNSLGYRLIHIWEDEWIKNKEEIKLKIKLILENKEVIKKNELLDRSWYNNISFSKEFPPIIIDRNGNPVENCGYLII